MSNEITSGPVKIALAGNPNVGKSTVFNALTGLKQHTGNWPGKTVASAEGRLTHQGVQYILADIPGAYSLSPRSAEEEAARDYICFMEPDMVVTVCDATALERNLNLVLQILETTDNLIVCVNLMDEAEKKKIRIDLGALEKKLGVYVTGASAGQNVGMDLLMDKAAKLKKHGPPHKTLKILYDEPIETAVSLLESAVKKEDLKGLSTRWAALRLIDTDESFLPALENYLGRPLSPDTMDKVRETREYLASQGVSPQDISDMIVSRLVETAGEIAKETVKYEKTDYDSRDRKIDRILTGRLTGIPIMLGLLALVFWLTVTGANYPSAMLADALMDFQGVLDSLFINAGAPEWVRGIVVSGAYRVLAWVVSVMLPPMAIFFPLFTLLEDLGYLPRVAFNLDKCFKRCRACGKQALTTAMGFGCNAAGVTGCRIIDSPRERFIAILTNSFVPCNGRFPTLIAIITIFFAAGLSAPLNSIVPALLLTGVIVLGVLMTFIASRFLSATMLKGVPSSFTLELPPYRKPRIGQVIIRSVFDRTLFVLGRAIAVAAPAGVLIWILANVSPGGITLLARLTQFLEPFGTLIGLDGVILTAFVLGFPANEIVVPIMVMSYLSTGSLMELDSLTELGSLFLANGWTPLTALNMIIFTLLHWPCSTTCLTIKKETGSFKWTVVSFLLPTAAGIIICFLTASVARIAGLV